MESDKIENQQIVNGDDDDHRRRRRRHQRRKKQIKRRIEIDMTDNPFKHR
jgi:hypothetical protein